MSSPDLEPIPGDLVAALNTMRSWEREDFRGHSGQHIQVGEQALVIGAWFVGNQLRLRVVRAERVLLFSSAAHAVRRNWSIVRAAPRLPTLGCP